MYKWVNHVLPSYNEFLLPYRDTCDQVIFNNTDEPEPIWDITNQISEELKLKLNLV
jgi:uridine kinase